MVSNPPENSQPSGNLPKILIQHFYVILWNQTNWFLDSTGVTETEAIDEEFSLHTEKLALRLL